MSTVCLEGEVANKKIDFRAVGSGVILGKGNTAPSIFGLPGNVRAASVNDWRDELFVRRA